MGSGVGTRDEAEKRLMSNVDALRQFVEPARAGGTVVEVGSRDGHDAAAMRDMFRATRVVTVEANPDAHKRITARYPLFENHCVAVLDRTGTTSFNRVRAHLPAPEVGRSSVLERDIYANTADRITVPCLTMDDLVASLEIEAIEALKIDVEGATYEALAGFTRLRMARLLHVEAEHREYWTGQHLYNEVADLLTESGFEQVHFEYAYEDQSDSIWRRR